MATTVLSAQLENLPECTRAATGFTHRVRLTTADLNESTVNTADTFTFTIPAFSSISDVLLDVDEALEDTADAAFNSNTISVGDNSGLTTFIAATETNINGTEVLMARMQMQTAAPTVYVAANTFKITVASMAAKANSTLTKGKFSVWVKMFTRGVTA